MITLLERNGEFEREIDPRDLYEPSPLVTIRYPQKFEVNRTSEFRPQSTYRTRMYERISETPLVYRHIPELLYRLKAFPYRGLDPDRLR